MATKIPWNKIKELAINLSGQLWDSEEKEVRRIVEALPTEERVIAISFNHTIDCSGDTPTVKTKISFSERFTGTASGSVDDPAQMTLGEVPEKDEEPAEAAD